MPRRLAIVLIAVTAVLVPVALAWAKQGPSRATQIRTAVGQAESSSDTWATVNICDTGAHPNSIGIRAQMPSLGVDAQLSMVFEVEYYSPTAGAYKPVPGSTVSVPLGSSTLGLRQSGFTLPLTPHAGTLRGVVTVQWSVGGQLVGSATRVTTAGHPDADYGDPGGYSSSVCVMR